MAATTVNIHANAAPVLIEGALTMRATADTYRGIADSCIREAEKLEVAAVGEHDFIYDPESGDCGECAYAVEHPCHPAPERLCGGRDPAYPGLVCDQRPGHDGPCIDPAAADG